MPANRYSRWDGSQDPWAEADDLLGAVSDDMLEFGDLQQALRKMLQRGFQLGDQSVTGLHSLMERLRAMRRREQRSQDVDSVVRRIEERLRDIERLERNEIDEREELRRASGDRVGDEEDLPIDQPPFGNRLAARRDFLDEMSDRPADALRTYRSYDFLSPEAETAFNQLSEELRNQMMQQYFRGAEQALSSMTPEALQRMKDMMSELNSMVRSHEAGEPYDFPGFMQRYGDFFPENPQSLEELLETLARRIAAAQAMMDSMSPDQRARLQELAGALMDDADLAFQMSELARAVRDAVPGDFWDRSFDFSGEGEMEWSEAVQLMERMQEADDLEQYLRGVSKPSDLDEVDLDRVEKLLGPEARVDLKRLREIERMLEQAGYVQRKGGRLDLTPQGVRRIGHQALGAVYQRLKAALSGEHDLPKYGQGGEVTGELKPYEFGEPFHIEVKQTVFEAVRRAGAGTPVKITPDDFMVERTERKVQAATALLIDLSLSMPMRGNWVAAKKVALSLHALISTMFPRDHLYLVGFSDYARRVQAEELPGLGWEEVYGTNMQHALMIGRRLLGAHRGATRQILMVTDGEPTAHLLPDGDVFFLWPPVQQTFDETLKEVVRCTKDGIVINTFMLDRSPLLTRFVEQMTTLNRGRAFFTSPERLGEYVLMDFLSSKRSMLRGA